MSAKQTLLPSQPWAPTRGEGKNASEQLVAQVLTKLGIDWAYEDRFLPLRSEAGITRGMCPDYRIKASRAWPEQFLEVTTAKQLTGKRRKARQASLMHGVPVTIIDRSELEQIARNPWHVLTLLHSV